LKSPLRSVSRNGPNPAKKCGAGWNITGTNRLSVEALPVVVTAPPGAEIVVLVDE
jgi:hypothetical protein